MACITKGHEVLCADKNRRGGINRIWLTETDNVDYSGFTVTAGLLTDMVASAAYEFEFDRETAGFTANASRENGSTVVDVELQFYIPKLTSLVNTRLDELTCSCGIVAIVETFADDGTDPYYFVLGWDSIFTKNAYLEFASGEMNTGLALQDANGTLVKLAGKQAKYPIEATVEIVADGGPADAAKVTLYQPPLVGGLADIDGQWTIS